MGFKEDLEREKYSLMSSKRPYETAAFLIFGILFLQQLIYMIRSVYLFVKNGWFVIPSIMNVGNDQAFFNRIIAIDSTKWLYVILALLALALYYFIIYILVWRYCKKRNLAKWTWTTLIVFGPSILFMPAYMFYILYIFRDYFFRFVKVLMEEYKKFDPSKMAKQDSEILKEEEAEAKKREKNQSIKDAEKEAEKKQKEAQKAAEKEAEKEEKTE